MYVTLTHVIYLQVHVQCPTSNLLRMQAGVDLFMSHNLSIFRADGIYLCTVDGASTTRVFQLMY